MSKLKSTVRFFVMAALVTGGPVQAEHGTLLSKQELRSLVESATTPEAHQRLAEHYQAHAALLEAEAEKHEASAASFRAYARTGGVSPKGAAIAASWRNAEHCDKSAEKLRRTAQEERALAGDHRRLASAAQPE